MQKGNAALAQWREDKAFAERKGGKFLEAWNEEQEAKRAAKEGTSRAGAINKFCRDCVGGLVEDIRNCTATQCALYNFRPNK